MELAPGEGMLYRICVGDPCLKWSNEGRTVVGLALEAPLFPMEVVDSTVPGTVTSIFSRKIASPDCTGGDGSGVLAESCCCDLEFSSAKSWALAV